jgi:hypothetical protein
MVDNLWGIPVKTKDGKATGKPKVGNLKGAICVKVPVNDPAA